MSSRTPNYRRLFVDFCRLETASGGPDPQQKILKELCRKTSLFDRALLAGLYAIIYDVSSAQYFWWQRDELLDAPEQFAKRHWDALIIRTERRCVRTKKNFYECFDGYVRWAKKFSKNFESYENLGRIELYDRLWEELNSLPYIGRYASIKLIRAIRECTGLKVMDYDIRPKNGWSPRFALGLLYPNKARMLNNKDSELADVNKVADNALSFLKKNGVVVDHYDLQAMLCEFRETLKGNRFYPGRSHDEVLENLYKKTKVRSKLSPDYDNGLAILKARGRLFPEEHLGEKWSWNGVRKELQATWKKYGYIWGDTEYDFTGTANLAKPKRW